MAPEIRKSYSTWFLMLISANIIWRAVGQDTPLNIQETGTSGSGVNDMNPQSIKVAMQMDKDYLSLNLIKNPNVDNYVPIVLSQNGLLSAWSKQRGADEKAREKAIRLLLSKNADVNLQDFQGRTALSYSCEMMLNDVIMILVKSNADPSIQDRLGNTPLIYSAMIGNDVAIDILIRSFRRLGLNIDHTNKAGKTALHLAASHGFIECATLLAVDGRANLSLPDPVTGLTADRLAVNKGCAPDDVVHLSPSKSQHKRNRAASVFLSRKATNGSVAPKFTDGNADDENEDEDEGIKADGDVSNNGDENNASTKRGRKKRSGLDPDTLREDARGAWMSAGQHVRNKRLSLPSSKLYSSFDTPGSFTRRLLEARTPVLEDPEKPEGPPGEGQGETGGTSNVVQVEETEKECLESAIAELKSALPSRMAHRKSRELHRADTDISHLISHDK